MSAGPDRPAATVRGFTLIELVVTIALIAILMAIAAPNFVTFQRNSQLTSTANSFIGSMAAARAEAMRSNANAWVVPDYRNGCSAGWTCGWYVFVDNNKDGNFGAGDLLVAEQAAPPATILTPANSGVTQFKDSGAPYVLFNGSGFPRTPPPSAIRVTQSLDFSYGSSTYGTSTRRIILSPTGRMRVCTPMSASDATCPTTDN